MSFLRHEEIYRSDVPGYRWERQLVVAAPALIGCDEFPVGYSLAGCPPAEPASASPTADDSQQSTLPYNDFSANGNYPLNFVSQSKGALHPASPATPPDMRVRIRRFGGLSRPHDQRRESELGKVSVRQSDGQGGRVGEAPRAVRTAGGLRRQVLPHTPFAKLAKPRPAPFPLLPHHRPKSAA